MTKYAIRPHPIMSRPAFPRRSLFVLSVPPCAFCYLLPDLVMHHTCPLPSLLLCLFLPCCLHTLLPIGDFVFHAIVPDLCYGPNICVPVSAYVLFVHCTVFCPVPRPIFYRSGLPCLNSTSNTYPVLSRQPETIPRGSQKETHHKLAGGYYMKDD